MLDDLAEIACRCIGRIFIEAFFECFFYYIGRVFLCIVTLGQYKGSKNSSEKGTVESITGMIVVLSTIILLIVINNRY